MPDGPVAAAIVLVAGLLLLGVGYLFTEARRPGRSRRHHHHREAERLPLFGTDQLSIRAADGTDHLVEPAELESEDADDPFEVERPRLGGGASAPPHGGERENGHFVPVVAERPAPRRSLAVAQPAGPRDGERSDAAPPRHAPAADSPRSREVATAVAPLEHDVGRAPAYARQPAAPTAAQPALTAPPRATRPVPAPQLAVTGYAQASFVDGETLRFAMPTDGTLQFLPGRLEVVAGADTGREVRFVRTPGDAIVEVTFGRSEGPAYRHVQLHARTVSRQHAMMSLIDEHWALRNLSTTNPVVLNGRVLAQDEVAPLLVDGDRIEMGEIVFLFHER